MDEVEFNPTGAERLITLAEFLETEVKDEEFDFNRFLVRREGACGSTGCAIGQMPRIWPNEIEVRENKIASGSVVTFFDIRVKGVEHATNYMAAAFWFGLTGAEAQAIFAPDTGEFFHEPEDEIHRKAGLNVLGEYARPTEVAANIRDFVNWKLAQEAA